MKGVMIPDASAGSNHVGASETWTPHVSWSGGAATAGRDAPANRPTPAAATKSRRPIWRVARAGHGSRPSRPELIPPPVFCPLFAGLGATVEEAGANVAVR